jgi:hypothetical protein
VVVRQRYGGEEKIMSEERQSSGESLVLNAILDEQRKQTKLLKAINTVMQLFGLLLLLAIALFVCNFIGLI